MLKIECCLKELTISSQNNSYLSLKLEKSLAILKLKQVDILESYTLIRSYVDKIIQNPTIHTALILIQNSHINTLPFKQALKVHSREKWERWLDNINHLFQTMEDSQVSWIAGLSGPCFGPSLQMALSCDYRIADLDTVFGFNELNSGLIPTGGACLKLPRLVGIKKAMDIILKGKTLSAKSAKSCGLIQSPVPTCDLELYLRKWAGKINKGLVPLKPPQKYQKLCFKNRLLEIPIFRYLFYYQTKKNILSETKKFYPAPLTALNLIKKTYPVKSLKADLKEESNAFCTLIVSPTAQNLIALHKNLEKMNPMGLEKGGTLEHSHPCDKNLQYKDFDKQNPRGSKQGYHIKKTAVIGAGTMGGGITHWLAHNNTPVLLKDLHSPSLSNTLKYIYHSLKEQTKKSWMGWRTPKNSLYVPHLLTSPSKKTNSISQQIQFSKIRPQVDYSGFSSADLIIETVVEDIEIKKKVIAESAGHSHALSLFASNTSSFKVSDLAQAHPDPSRFFGLHFFYPARHSALVEVVQGAKSQPLALKAVREWIWQRGKVSFVVKDSPGFLVQRLFLPLISEALWCLKEGAEVQHIDQVYTSFGFRAGPFQLMDELGLDIFLKLVQSFQQAGHPLSLPKEISQLKSGFLGQKNKKGFYIYNEKRKILSVNHQMCQDLGIKTSYKTISHILERGLYRMINESALLLKEKVVETPTEVDLALILGLGFPAFRGGLLKYANDISLKTVIAGLQNFAHEFGDRFQACPALLACKDANSFTSRHFDEL